MGKEEIKETVQSHVSSSLMISTLYQVLLGWSIQSQWDGQGRWHIWGRREVHTCVGHETWRKENHLQDPDI